MSVKNKFEIIKHLLFVVAIGILIASNIKRNVVWADEISLWSDAVSKAFSRDGHFDNFPFVKVRPLYNLGMAYLSEQNYKKAYLFYKRVLVINPDYHKAKYYLSEALFHLGRHRESLRYLTEVEFLFVNVLPHFREKFEAAGREIREELIYHNMASNYYRLDNFSKANEYYRKALKINPNYFPSREGLIESLIEQRKNKEAVIELEDLLNLARSDYEKRQEAEELLLDLKGRR